MSNTATQFSSLDDAVQHWMEHWKVPGIALGLYRNGNTTVHPHGVASLETGFAVRDDTAFQIGSISKLFTATLIMKLVEDGKLDLDVPVREYVPDLRLADEGAASTITLRHLLTHTSGFWGDWFADFGLGDDANDRFVAEYAQLRQITAPGELWTYNNCGYILAGLAAARANGTTFDGALRQHVIEPLGLEHTFLSAAEAIAYPLAVGHTNADGAAHVAHQFLRPRARNAAGGVIASAGDVLTFARSHLTGQPHLLSDGTRKAMRAPEVETFETNVSWGLGFHLEDRGGRMVVGHGGATNGFRASLQMVPDDDFAISVLTNSDSGAAAAREIVNWALQEYCGIAPPHFETVALPSELLQSYAGRYSQPYGGCRIRVAGEALEAQLSSASPYSERDEEIVGEWTSLRPIGEDEFVFTSGEMKGNHVRFWRYENGDVRFLQMGGRLYDPAGTD